jgi:hypothetical protein
MCGNGALITGMTLTRVLQRMADPGWTKLLIRIVPGCCAVGLGSSTPWICRSAFRYDRRPDDRGDDVGFRVCCLPQDLLLYP